jgi:hypothetical protein
MTPRRIHEPMRKHFPPVEHAAPTWSLVQDQRGPNTEAIANLLAEHVPTLEVIVEVHRKLGAPVPIADAPAYVARHIG